MGKRKKVKAFREDPISRDLSSPRDAARLRQPVSVRDVSSPPSSGDNMYGGRSQTPLGAKGQETRLVSQLYQPKFSQFTVRHKKKQFDYLQRVASSWPRYRSAWEPSLTITSHYDNRCCSRGSRNLRLFGKRSLLQ